MPELPSASGAESAARSVIGPGSVVERNEAIVFTEIDGAVVMMDVDEGRYFELDEIGGRIWALIESGASVATICEALLTEYEVAADVCQRDVLEFVAEARDLGVIRIPATDDEARTPAR